MFNNHFLSRFGLDSHHRMERFCVIFCILASILLILTGISFKIRLDRDKIRLGQKALYTKGTIWSITGQEVEVLNIYRNDDSSKIFIFFRTGHGPDDMLNMSLDANDYQILMTGRGKEKLTNNPQAAYYVFGNTGYMGMYFVDTRGFDSHMYDIVVRNTKLLTTDIDEEGQAAYDDESFHKYNQMRMYQNFAGTDAPVAEFLNKEDATVQEIYAELVATIDEKPVRDMLDADLLKINDNMRLANQYAHQLNNQGIRIPELPIELAGDAITLDENDTVNNPQAFDKSMLSAQGNIINSDYNSADVNMEDQFKCVSVSDSRDIVDNMMSEPTEQNNYGEDEDDYDYQSTNNDITESDETDVKQKFYFVTDYVFPGGYQYNYQDMQLISDRMKSLKPDDMSFQAWTESKLIEKQTYPTIKSHIDDNYYKVWYNSDGSEFNVNDTLAVDTVTKQLIDSYVKAIETIYATKYKYQVEDLYALLRVEASTETSDAMFSINVDPEVLIIY